MACLLCVTHCASHWDHGSEQDRQVPSLMELLRHRQPFVTGLPEIKGRHASAQHKDEIPVTTVVQHWAGCLVRKGIFCW